MKHATPKAMSWLLSLALMLSLVPVLTPTARATSEAYTVSGAGVATINDTQTWNVTNLQEALNDGDVQIIDGGGASVTVGNTALSVDANETAILKNLTLTGAKKSAITCEAGSTLILDGCSFVDNENEDGGAISMTGNTDRKSYLYANNTVFLNNTASRCGGAIYINGSSQSTPGACAYLMNCTMKGNQAATSSFGSAVHENGTAVYAVNSIFCSSGDHEFYINRGSINLVNCLYNNLDNGTNHGTSSSSATGGAVITEADSIFAADTTAANYAPVKSGDATAKGVYATYFNYADSTAIKMGYRTDSGTTVYDITGTPVDTGTDAYTEHRVTTYFESVDGSPVRAASVIGASGVAVPAVTYDVTIPDTTNGTVTADKKTAAAGEPVTLTVSPNEGYVLSALSYTPADGDAQDITVNTSGEYTFTMPASDVTVTARFIPVSATASFIMNVVIDQEKNNLLIKLGSTITGYVEARSDADVDVEIEAAQFNLIVPEGVTDLALSSASDRGSTEVNNETGGYIYSGTNQEYVTIPAGGSLKLATFTAKVGTDTLAAAQNSKVFTLGLTGCYASQVSGYYGGLDVENVSVAEDSGKFTVTDAYTVTFKLNDASSYFLPKEQQPANAVPVYEDSVITAYTITVARGASLGVNGLVKVEKPYCTFDGWVYEGTSTAFTETTTVSKPVNLVPKGFTPNDYHLTIVPAEASDTDAFYNFTPGEKISEAGDDLIVHYDQSADIAFTLTPVGNCVLGVQYRVGTDGALGTDGLMQDGNTYTLSGSQITDNITIVVSKKAYHKVTFVAGTGTKFEDGAETTAWVRDGETTLYSSLDAVIALDTNAIFTVPTVAVLESEGYRAVKEDEGEYLWLDNKNSGWTSVEVGRSRVFTSDVEILTAQAVKQVSVSLYRLLKGESTDAATLIETVKIDQGTTLTEGDIPALDPVAGYVTPASKTDGWKYRTDNAGVNFGTDTFEENTEIYITYEHASYDVIFNYQAGAFDNVTVKIGSDPDTLTEITESNLDDQKAYKNSATHGTTLYIQVSPKENKAITQISASYGSYTITGSTYLFTFPGDQITNGIYISFASADGITITATVEHGTFTSGGGTTKIVTVFPDSDGNYTVDYSQFLVTGDPNYAGLDADAVSAFIPSELTESNDNETYALTCQPAVYTVTVQYQVGENDPVQVHTDQTTYFNDYSYTLILNNLPNDLRGKCFITDVTATVGSITRSGATAALTNVNGALVITYQLASVTWEWIKKDTYKALENGTKIAVLKADGAENGSKTYTLNGATMYWSSRYGAFLAIVADNEGEDETDLAVALCGALVRSNMSTTDDMRLKYNGDVTGNGSVNVIDTVPINDALHGVATYYLITDQMRLEMDVVDVDNDSDNLKTVDLQDVLEILQKAVGRINKLPHETDPS